VLNEHVSNEDKSDGIDRSFYDELECVFDHFPSYHTKILLDYNENAGRENIFKLTIGYENLHYITSNKGVGEKTLPRQNSLSINFPASQHSIITLGLLPMGKHTPRLMS
jgi:hypothetical protein